MRQVINESKQLNEHIRASEEYRTYLRTKQALLENEELSRHLQEFRAKNYELQNRQGVNPYDEMIELTREYDELLHNSVVSDFLQAEQQICKLLQRVFDSIAEGLEFEEFFWVYVQFICQYTDRIFDRKAVYIFF